jgi:TolB protein
MGCRLRDDAGRARLAAAAWLTLAASVLAVSALAPRAGGQAERGPPPGTELDGPAGLIAFVTGDGQPWVVDPESGTRAALSSAPQRAQFPAWSPAGAAVSFIAIGPAGAGVDVYQLEEGTGAAGPVAPVRVYGRATEPPIYHGWSPDARWLALLANRADGLGLYLAPAPGSGSGDDGREPHLLATGAPFYWDWSPDGDSLLVHRNVLGPDAELGFTALASYALAPSFDAPGAVQSPAVAPSGEWIAYATRDAGDTRRVVLLRVAAAGAAGGSSVEASAGSSDAAGEARRELPHAGFAAVAWHPRHDVVAVQRGVLGAPHGYGPIVTIDARTGDLSHVTDDFSLAFWWAPDGGSIAYLSPVAGAATPERQVALRVQGGGVRLALRVVDLDTGFTRELGRFTPSPLFLHQYLPFFDQYARSHRLWSPASDALVLPVIEGGASTLVVYGLDGSVRILGPGDMPAWNVR